MRFSVFSDPNRIIFCRIFDRRNITIFFSEKNISAFHDFFHCFFSGFDLRHRPRQGKEAVNQVLKWGCPKCRSTYEEKDIPTRYTCFCGKVVDPEFDPWIVPHSCGETCGRKLKPDCGHQCLILCHPGPCPPCPKVRIQK